MVGLTLVLLVVAGFVAGPGGPVHAAASEVLIPVQGFRFTGNSAFADETLASVVAGLAGRELTFAELEEAAERVTRFYRDRGFLVAQAMIPAQEIGEDGIVQIAVQEGRYGQVTVRNESRLRDEGVVRGVLGPGRIFPGALIQAKPLERALLLLNEVPGVTARGELAAGSEPGTSDLVVYLQDGSRLTGVARVDNSGHELTGPIRGSVMVDANSPRGLGDRLSLQVTSAGAGMRYGSITYSAPLQATPFRLSVGYTSSRYEMGGALAALDVDGTMSALRLSLSYPVLRALSRSLDGELAFEQRSLEDRVATLLGKRTVQALQLATRGSGQAWSGTVNFDLVATAGRLHIVDAVERLFDGLTARTEGEFVKVNADVTHRRPVGGSLSLQATVSGQWASKNLHSSEKFSLGGPRAVRAYGPGEASGDVGALSSIELQGRLFRSAWRWAGFVDAGFVQLNKEPWQAGVNTRALYGVGVGLIYAPGSSFDLRLDYAVPVAGDAAAGRLSAAASMRW